jgi:hypothetical protein
MKNELPAGFYWYRLEDPNAKWTVIEIREQDGNRWALFLGSSEEHPLKTLSPLSQVIPLWIPSRKIGLGSMIFMMVLARQWNTK